MQSSVEEFLLILNRWKTEFARVRVAATFLSEGEGVSTTVMEGHLEVEQASSTLRVISDDGSMFMLGFAGTGVGYATTSDMDPNTLGALIQSPEEIEDILIVRYSLATICLFSLKR